MNLEELVGKKEKVKIIGLVKNEKYFKSKGINSKNTIYIENDGDYEKEELLETVQECLITNVINGNLVGFILSNRKFHNDLYKIDEKLKDSEEYDNIKDIYLMERLKIKGKVVGLYMVDEGEIGKYYLDTIEIGTYLKKLRDNNIIFKDRKIEDEFGKQIRDVVQSIDLTKKEISLGQEQERQRDLIKEALGIEDEEILQIIILDLDQRLEDKEQEQFEQEQIEQRKKEEIKSINENKKDFSTIKDVKVKQETRMEGLITDFKTLGQVLEKNGKLPHIEGKKFSKMGVIESDQSKKLVNEKGKQIEKRNSTRYSFVAIANDGTVVPIDLQQDRQESINPMERNYQVNQKGEVFQDDINSRYRIGDGTLSIKNGQMGELEIYHSARKTIGGPGIEGNKSLDRQLESKNVWRMKKQVRDIAKEYGSNYRTTQKGYEEAKEHEDKSGNIRKEDEKRIRAEDIDGDKNTKTHTHENVNYEALASKWGYYIDGKPNSQRAQELFEEKAKQNPNKKEEEIIEMVTEDLENDLHHRREER